MAKIIFPKKGKNVLELPGICGTMFHNSKGLELVELSIEPGKSIASHVMPIDVIFYLLNGELEFHVDNEKFILKTNQVIEITADSERAVNNKSLKTSKLLVIKKMKNLENHELEI